MKPIQKPSRSQSSLHPPFIKSLAKGPFFSMIQLRLQRLEAPMLLLRRGAELRLPRPSHYRVCRYHIPHSSKRLGPTAPSGSLWLQSISTSRRRDAHVQLISYRFTYLHTPTNAHTQAIRAAFIDTAGPPLGTPQPRHFDKRPCLDSADGTRLMDLKHKWAGSSLELHAVEAVSLLQLISQFLALLHVKCIPLL